MGGVADNAAAGTTAAEVAVTPTEDTTGAGTGTGPGPDTALLPATSPPAPTSVASGAVVHPSMMSDEVDNDDDAARVRAGRWEDESIAAVEAGDLDQALAIARGRVWGRERGMRRKGGRKGRMRGKGEGGWRGWCACGLCAVGPTTMPCCHLVLIC